jgi:peptidoglycan/xylan/chitin deacetylase (PgdA/CDA1 family)
MSAATGGGPLASLSLDLDNLWSYLKTHGDPGWETRPSYLERFLPRVLDLLDECGLRITFFVVGADAARDEHARGLRAITARGHEVGNHSHEHEPWLHAYGTEQLESEIERAEQAIAAACGMRPVGFRGPGFSWSPALLEILAERRYLFDASTLPTFLGPIARAYYFRTARLSREERAQRRTLFGSFRQGLGPVRPYRWRLQKGTELLEIPVTTMPGLRTPFHLSYLLYLSRVSTGVALAYLRAALVACRMAGVAPSFLLHPLDFLGRDDVPELSFFPAMDFSGRRKVALFRRVAAILGEHFTLVTMGSHARSLLRDERVPVRSVMASPA